MLILKDNYKKDIFRLNLDSETIVNKNDVLFALVLRKAQAGRERIDEVKSLLNCLHLNQKSKQKL